VAHTPKAITHLGSHICSYTFRQDRRLLVVTVPTTISKSAWRGEKRGSAAPKRSVSYGDALTAMNSIAQQAVTNGYGKIENLRAQPISSSLRVVRYSNEASLLWAAGTIGMVRAYMATGYSVTPRSAAPCRRTARSAPAGT